VDLCEFAVTDRQRQILQALSEHGTQAKAAKALGITQQSVSDVVLACKKRAALAGYAPEYGMNHPAPPGFAVKGVSTLVDAETGEQKLQWIKTDRDQARQQAAIEAMLDALKEDIPKERPWQKTRQHHDSDLLNLFMVTDYHVGMKAWGEECGEDWDLSIAEDLLLRWFDKAIQLSPPAETAYFAQLGDFLHWDSLEAVTPASRHLLDADTRHQKMVRVAIRLLRHITRRLLETHDFVHLLIAEGNHDVASSGTLREAFSQFMDDEPRLTVETSPMPFYCHEHGDTVLFFHHGHKVKPKLLHTRLAGNFREEYGRSKHAYAHLGHLHFDERFETDLMMVEQHRTLAARDSYAARHGWKSGRDAKVITYHKQHGEVSRLVISPDMV
jgi:hypothetical protein